MISSIRRRNDFEDGCALHQDIMSFFFFVSEKTVVFSCGWEVRNTFRTFLVNLPCVCALSVSSGLMNSLTGNPAAGLSTESVFHVPASSCLRSNCVSAECSSKIGFSAFQEPSPKKYSFPNLLEGESNVLNRKHGRRSGRRCCGGISEEWVVSCSRELLHFAPHIVPQNNDLLHSQAQ